MSPETIGRRVPADRPLLAWGAGIVGLMALLAAAAPLLAPHDPLEQIDPAASRHRPPGTRMYAVRLAGGGWLLADAVESGDETVRLLRLGRWQELPRHRLHEPQRVSELRTFLLGTDRLGRDLLSRILYGARVSLLIGLVAAALALAAGLFVGGVAGLAGGWLDAALMRLVDAMLCFPRLFLLLAMAALFELSTAALVLVLGATSWMSASRLVRAEVRAARGRDFVAAARSTGVPPVRVLARHLLPAALTPVIVTTALQVGDLILIEAALSFLGLGVQPPLASWGNIIADGRDALQSAWWVAALPGGALALTVIGLNLIGDGLRHRFDPRPT